MTGGVVNSLKARLRGYDVAHPRILGQSRVPLPPTVGIWVLRALNLNGSRNFG
jgi:hypothetical protein